MRYLLDTNVISEWARARPDPAVVAWLDVADEDALHLSVLAFAEIRLGIELLLQGRKRARLSAWLDGDLAARFAGRIIGIERDIAEAWAAIVARGRVRGAIPPILDAFVVATALVHQLTLVTRNELDLAGLDVPIVNLGGLGGARARIARPARSSDHVARRPMFGPRMPLWRRACAGGTRRSLAV